MKKPIIVVLLFFLSNISFGQVFPNSSFESWSNQGLYETPEPWNTPDSITSQFGIITVSKSPDAYYGNYSARLETKELLGVYPIPGLLTLAEFSINAEEFSYEIMGGLALKENVSKLTGMYKYEGADGDSASIIIYNFKRDSTNEIDTIGFGIGSLPDASEWTLFTVNMENLNNHIPDTFNVVILSSSGPDFKTGSILYVDSLAIEINTGIINLENNQIKVNVYPNPTTEFIQFETKGFEKGRQISIYNTVGSLITSIDFSNGNTKFSVENFPPGHYSYQITNNKSIINSGSFIKN